MEQFLKLIITIEWRRLDGGEREFILHCHHHRGTEEYGDPEDDSKPWSELWTLEEAEEFLFASGNLKYWLVVNRAELIGVDGRKFYGWSYISITASSDNQQPYHGKSLRCLLLLEIVNVLARLRNRGPGHVDGLQDPHVSIRDIMQQMLYTEGSTMHGNTLLMTEGGMDVFIRKN